MLLIGRIDAVAPLARLAVQILPTGEGPACQEVVFNEVERPLDARGTIGVADLMGHETESHTLRKRRHLGHWFHLLTAAAQHHHVRVIDHGALWRAAHVAQRFGEKRLAIETLKLRPDLEVEQARVAQHRRGGLRLVFASADNDLVR
jgi:hypothetical protein